MSMLRFAFMFVFMFRFMFRFMFVCVQKERETAVLIKSLISLTD